MISIALSCSPDVHGRGESGATSVFAVGGSESSRSRTQFAAACTPAAAGTLRQRTNTSPNNSEPTVVPSSATCQGYPLTMWNTANRSAVTSCAFQ